MSHASSRQLTALGFMAGTSLDGVDAAVIVSDGMGAVEMGPCLHMPYDRDTKIAVTRATKAALEGRETAQEITKAIDLVTTAHIRTAQKLMEQHYLTAKEIDIIGFHGQTILHRPKNQRNLVGRSWQIGAGTVVAQELKIDVVDDFRAADIAAGGEGAPFAPVYHNALVRAQEPSGPVCVLNLGGVGNVTYVPEDGLESELIAFDTGPANGLIDQWMELKTGKGMDEDGKMAAKGKVNEEALQLMALNPYLRRQPPKSLDRYDFKLTQVEGLNVEDGAATLTAFTAECIARAADLLPAPPVGWVICGGGRHNPVMMKALAERLDAPIKTAEDVDWQGDFIEAQCFAYLAIRSLKKLPLSFPKTTNVPSPLTGGHYHKGRGL